MTVKELREALASYPDDLIVIMSKDAEGNGYSPLAGPDQALYVVQTTWSGDVYCPTDKNIPRSAIPCVVLDPVN